MTPELEENMQLVAEHAADLAVEKLFLKIGVDVSTPAEVLKVQKDFAQLRVLTESIALVRRRSITTAVTVVVTGVLGAIYALWKHV